jgi:hypothetical protein
MIDNDLDDMRVGVAQYREFSVWFLSEVNLCD